MIYHYTTIETLDLILTSKTIRFNNLNDVDDKRESKFFHKKSLSQFIFVSCWTKDSLENIPLWMMYSHGHGVRIALPDYPWRKIDCKLWDTKEIQLTYDPGKSYISPFHFHEILADDHFVMPPFSLAYPNPAFAKEVIYINDLDQLAGKYEDLYSIKTNDQRFSIKINPKEFGLYKHAGWSFQREFRFVLWIVPLSGKPDLNDPNFFEPVVEDMYQYIEQDRPVTRKDYYLPLGEKILEDIEVMSGPLCNDKEVSTIRDILQKHGLSTSIQKSQSEIRS